MTDVDDELNGDEPSQPWHHSTRAVLGASAAGAAVIAVIVASVVYVTGADEPADAPLNFVEPSFSTTASRTPTSATTTTATITSTAPLSTTEINEPPGPSTTSDSSSTSPSSSESPSVSRPPEEDDGPTIRTPRRPRTNVTRTLLPQPIG